MLAASTCSDFFRFLRFWLSNPKRVSAVAPSGRSLSRLMTREIGPGEGPVLELGPGTGVFTRALLARGIQERDLTLIEYGQGFANLLEERFPDARVLRMDASHLAQCDLFTEKRASAVISGLPLLSMPPDKIEAILTGAFHQLQPGGAFYQFTYGPRCPIPRSIVRRNGLVSSRVGGTLRNMPPASVYRIARRENSGGATEMLTSAAAAAN